MRHTTPVRRCRSQRAVTGVSVKPTGGTALNFTFDASKNINLLALTGVNSADLLNGKRLTAEACSYPADSHYPQSNHQLYYRHGFKQRSGVAQRPG